MSLDGLRAWIGVVERKLLVRTRIFLVLVAIAVGGAGAAIYLAIDAQDNSVSKADVETVRDELEERGSGGDLSRLEGEIETLRAEIAALASSGATGSDETSGSSAGGASPDNANPSAKQLEELLKRAKEQAGQ